MIGGCCARYTDGRAQRDGEAYSAAYVVADRYCNGADMSVRRATAMHGIDALDVDGLLCLDG